MNLSFSCRTLGLFALTLVSAALGGCAREKALTGDVARGARIVNNVGMCSDCHTPHLQDGTPDPAHPLGGAPLAFAPLVQMPWAAVAPPIAGLPSLNDDEAFTFLTTGKLPRDRQARPPMPQYRFSAQEALDIIAYLKSLAVQ